MSGKKKERGRREKAREWEREFEWERWEIFRGEIEEIEIEERFGPMSQTLTLTAQNPEGTLDQASSHTPLEPTDGTNHVNNVGSGNPRGTRLQEPQPTPHGTFSPPNPAKPPRPGPGAPQAASPPHGNPLKPSISYPDLSKTDHLNDASVRSNTSLGPAIKQSNYYERARSHTPQPLPSGSSEPDCNHLVRNSPRQTSGKNQLPGSALVLKRPVPQAVPLLSDPGTQGRPDIANSTESTVISSFRPRNPNITNLPTYPQIGDTGHSQCNTQEWPTATEPRPPTSAPVPTPETHGTYSRPSDPREYNASQPPSQGSEIPSNAVDTNAASERGDNSPAAINIYHIHNFEHGQRLCCLGDSAQKSEVYGSHFEVACAQWKIDGLGSKPMLTILNVGTNLYAAPDPLSGKAGQALVAKGIKHRWYFVRVPAPDLMYHIRLDETDLYWKLTRNHDMAVVELLPGPPSTHEYHWVIQKKQSPGDGRCGWHGCE